MKIKRHFWIFSFIFLFAGSVYFSCSNISSTGAQDIPEGKVRLCGNLSLPQTEGAVPEEVAGINASFQNNLNGSSDGRAATFTNPDINDTTKYEYYVEAVCGSTTITEATWTSNGSAKTFSMELDYGSWEVEAGIKEKGSDTIIYSSKEPVSLQEGGPKTYSKAFVARPGQSDWGKINLNMQRQSDFGISFVRLNFISGNEDNWNYSFGMPEQEIILNVPGGSFNIGSAEKKIKSGTYTIGIEFYNEPNVPQGFSYADALEDVENGKAVLIYSTIQTINIYDNLTTNRWVSSGNSNNSSDNPILTDGSFCISNDLIDNYTLTNICVSSSGSDTNFGTVYNPYKTMTKALSYINERGSTSKDFTISVSGEVECNTEISLSGNKAKSIKIQGKSGNNANDKLNGAGKGRVLNINTTIPVTIENLTITGGDAGNGYAGGGILINKDGASVILGDGAKVSGNKAQNGGGICVMSGASLFMHGTALVGDSTNSKATGDTLGTECSNYASNNGGGIYNNGNVYLGYSGINNGTPVVSSLSGGIRRNFSSMGSAGVENYAGSYLKIDSGYVSFNSTKQQEHVSFSGGGIHLYMSTLEVTGGEISYNEADSGGGISATYNSEVKLSGGKIAENTARNGEGGAIDVSVTANNTAKLYLKDSVYIPYGVNGSKGEGKNDVYLDKLMASNGNYYAKIFISGTLTPPSGVTTVATITMPEWKRGIQFLEKSGDLSKLTTDIVNKFSFTDSDWEKQIYQKTNPDDSARIYSPVYVAGTNVTGTVLPGTDFDYGRTKAEGALGTKHKPFSTINEALSVFEDSGEAEIKIAGTVIGAQTIGGTGVTIKPTAIILTSYSTSKVGTLKRYNSKPTNAATDGTALTIDTTVPVTINGITITNGKKNGAGGGIELKKSGAKVILGNNTIISNNEATNGAGVYVPSGTTLEITGSAQMTGNKATTNGGAVYNDGTFTMSAGTIGGSQAAYKNSVTASSGNGGAVYQNGDFNLSGSANLYFSGNAEKTNDVYLASDSKYITVNNSLSGNGYILSVTPYTWKRGNQVIKADGTKITTISSTIASRFIGSDSEWFVTDHSNVGKIDAQLWVSGTGYASASGVGSGSDSNTGTKSKPYASIEKAAEQCWATNKQFTINISGMISNATQKIPAANSTNGTTLASKITLQGLTGNSKDGINRGLVNSDAVENGSALIINYQGYVDIKNLMIMGGNTTGYGGGIKINGPSTFSTTSCPRVNLMDGALIQQNQAQNGAGIYSYHSILCLSGSAIIGRNSDSTDRSASNTALSDGINKASYTAGGIYNSGYLYLGGAWVNGSIVSSGYTLTGGIYGNVCYSSAITTDYDKKRGAGGIFNLGCVYFYSGNINYNYGVSVGGIYNFSDTNTGCEILMSGGTIHKNAGCGIYNDTKAKFWMYSDATIGDRFTDSAATSNTDCSNTNGGIQNFGTTWLGYLSGSVKAKLNYGIYRNYSGSGAGINNKGTLYFDSGNIAYNYASSNGGGIYSTTTVNMTSSSSTQYSSITNNVANNGGGLYLSSTTANLFMSGYAIIGMSGVTAPPSSDTATGINKASNYGGGIYAESGAKMYFGYSKYTDGGNSDQETLSGGVCYNYAGKSGGGVYCNGYVSAVEIRMLSGIINANIATNSSTSNGMGGGIWMNYNCKMYMGGGTINKNKASRFGGGLYLSKDAKIYMYGTALIGETGTVATNSSYGNTAISGGGVYAIGEGSADDDLRPSVNLGCRGEDGTGIFGENLNSSYGIRRNYASGATSDIEYEVNGVSPGTGFGGGVYCQFANFYVQSGVVGYNLAAKGGGVAIRGNYETYDYWMGLQTSSAQIIGNKATVDGGGVYLKRQKFRVQGSIEYNIAETNGGGIYNNIGEINISSNDGKVYNNQAKYGGGIYSADGSSDASSGTINMTYGYIQSNYASIEGGGVYVNNYNDYFCMSGGTMSSNTAGSYGGAVSGKIKIQGNISIVPVEGGKERNNDIYCDGVNSTRAVDFIGQDTDTSPSYPLYITLGSSFNPTWPVVGSGDRQLYNYTNYKLTPGTAVASDYKINNYGNLVPK